MATKIFVLFHQDHASCHNAKYIEERHTKQSMTVFSPEHYVTDNV